MRILASGCSFTTGGPKQSWPSLLMHPRHHVCNLGRSSAGNKYICQSIISELSIRPNFYKIVLVMWSGLSRVDLGIAANTFQLLNGSYDRDVNGRYFGLVGDAYTHAHGHDMLKPFGQEYFKLVNEEASVYESLIQMICLQSFLKSINMPYRFMSYVNYWNDLSQVTDLNCGVYKYQSCHALIEQLDFDNFIFYNNQRDGIYELAKENNWFADDRFHPSVQGHQAWADLVKEKISEV